MQESSSGRFPNNAGCANAKQTKVKGELTVDNPHTRPQSIEAKNDASVLCDEKEIQKHERYASGVKDHHHPSEKGTDERSIEPLELQSINVRETTFKIAESALADKESQYDTAAIIRAIESASAATESIWAARLKETEMHFQQLLQEAIGSRDARIQQLEEVNQALRDAAKVSAGQISDLTRILFSCMAAVGQKDVSSIISTAHKPKPRQRDESEQSREWQLLNSNMLLQETDRNALHVSDAMSCHSDESEKSGALPLLNPNMFLQDADRNALHAESDGPIASAEISEIVGNRHIETIILPSQGGVQAPPVQQHILRPVDTESSVHALQGTGTGSFRTLS